MADTQMISLMAADSAGTCKFQGDLRIRPDPKDETGYLALVKARFTCANEADVRAWERIWPGVTDEYQRCQSVADEKRKREWENKNAELKVLFSLQRGSASGGDDFQAAARVKKARAALSKKQTTVDVDLIFGGVQPEQGATLMRLLRGHVHTETQNRQQDLFPQGGQSDALPPEKAAV